MAAKKPDFLNYKEGSTEITMSRPVDIMGVKVTVMTMREPTVGDNEASQEMSGGDATREIHTFANLCGVSPDDIRKMPMRDYARLTAAYLAFHV